MKKIFLLFLLSVVVFFTACSTKQEKIDYTTHIKNNPKSILLIISNNLSKEADIENAILAHSIVPLTEAGHYVMPVDLVSKFLKENGYEHYADIKQIPLYSLSRVFGAHSVIYIRIMNFGVNYQLINSQTIVHLEAELIDLRTKEQLWHRDLKLLENSNSGGGGGLIGLIVDLSAALVSQAVNTETNRALEILPYSTWGLFYEYDCENCLLRGEYSPYFRQDLQLKKH